MCDWRLEHAKQQTFKNNNKLLILFPTLEVFTIAIMFIVLLLNAHKHIAIRHEREQMELSLYI